MYDITSCYEKTGVICCLVIPCISKGVADGILGSGLNVLRTRDAWAVVDARVYGKCAFRWDEGGPIGGSLDEFVDVVGAMQVIVSNQQQHADRAA